MQGSSLEKMLDKGALWQRKRRKETEEKMRKYILDNNIQRLNKKEYNRTINSLSNGLKSRVISKAFGKMYADIVLKPVFLGFLEKNSGNTYSVRELIEDIGIYEVSVGRISCALSDLYRRIDNDVVQVKRTTTGRMNYYKHDPGCADARRIGHKKWCCYEEDCNTKFCPKTKPGMQAKN